MKHSRHIHPLSIGACAVGVVSLLGGSGHRINLFLESAVGPKADLQITRNPLSGFHFIGIFEASLFNHIATLLLLPKDSSVLR